MMIRYFLFQRITGKTRLPGINHKGKRMLTTPLYTAIADTSETRPGHHQLRRSLKKAGLVLPLAMAALASSALAQQPEESDTLTFNAGLGHTWDSNYDRDPQENQEQITTGSAGVEFDRTFSRQRLSASIGATRFNHDQRNELDTTVWGGGAAWRGEVGDHFRTLLSWSRSERLVDRAEFEGKDVITEDELEAGLVLVSGNNLEFPITARRVDQEHSNESQDALDYTDEEASAGIRWVTNRRSHIGINVISGQRDYPSQYQDRPEDIPRQEDLNFDYRTVELETLWVISPKTQLESRLGYFNREGDVNDGSGGMALVEGRWQPTAKLDLVTGLELTQPAIGETSNSPSENRRLYVDVVWQATPKISLGTGYAYVEHEFDENPVREARSETTNRINPLIARYQFTDQVEFNLTSAWLKRSSRRDDRDFEASIVTLGIDLTL